MGQQGQQGYQGYQGQARVMVDSQGRRCTEEPYDYLFQYTVVEANGVVENLSQAIDNDSDFLLCSVETPADAADFGLQFTNASKSFLQSGYLPSQVLIGFPQGDALVMDPEVFYPANGQILINLQDESGDPGNVVRVLFRGIRRRYV